MKVLNYDWSQIDVKIGLTFMIGVLITFYVLGGSVTAQTLGTAALLAWCTILLVPPQSYRRDLTGLAAYFVFGAALVWLAAVASSNAASFLIAMFAVTFVGYFLLVAGAHAFMVGWCLVYWFMLVPLFMAGDSLERVMKAHLIGTGLVIALNVLKPLWSGRRAVAPAEAQPSEPAPTIGYIASYATVVATSCAGGIAIGIRWLATDPTVIANATLNIISPSFKAVWRSAVERVVLASLGVIIGFYLGWFFPNELFGQLLTAAAAFAALAMTRVSFGLVIGFLMVMTAYPWGVMHSDAGHLIANEKLIGDAIGVVIALLAIGVLTRLKKADPA